MARNRKNYTTRVVCFAELTVDETIQREDHLPVEPRFIISSVCAALRGEALIIDHNYFLKDVVRDLTPEIAERSIYEYMEKDLGESIVTTKRKMTVERVNQIDETYLDLKDYNCMAVVSSMTYNKEGVMFEFTQSRHRPTGSYFTIWPIGQSR